jgi:hypothetical protein
MSEGRVPRCFAPTSQLGPTARALSLAIACGISGCTETLDAGATRPHGLLPVDERNPLVIVNDGVTDNWQGEYAVLLANGSGPPLAGIVVTASPAWPELDQNVGGWRALVTAARDSGLGSIPDPVASVGEVLERPLSGAIDETVPNRSEGARHIVDVATRLSEPYRPVVVATGTRLTDVADAYLLEPGIASQIVVVSSLGALSATGAGMSNPNGEMDPWADFIVSTRLRYVQVSAYYDQLADVPDSRLAELPDNAFGAWIAAKQPDIYSIEVASDQVSVLAAGVPAFAATVSRVSARGEPTSSAGPELVPDPDGNAWLVTQSDATLATTRFWERLLDPRTFGN